MIAVQRNAETYHVVLVFGKIERRAGVGGVHDRTVAARADAGDERVEALRLQLCKRRVGFRLGKVREHAVHPYVRTGVERIEKRIQLLVVEHADAAHAGVDLDVRMRVLAGGFRTALERKDLFRRKDGGSEIVCDDPGHVIRIGHAEDQDRQGDAVRAKTHAFLGNGDREHIDDAGTFEIAPDLLDTVSVGVGLDDRQKLRFRLERALCMANILQKSGQMNDRIRTAKHKITSNLLRKILLKRLSKVNRFA